MTDTNTLAPSYAEIDAIADQHKASGHGTVWPHAFARAVLAKWGTPAPTFHKDERRYAAMHRAALAPAPSQAAPVDAAVQQDAERWQFLAEYLVSTRTDLDDEIVGCDSVQKMARVLDAARAAQGGAAC